MKLNLGKNSIIAIILALCGFVLVYMGATFAPLSFLVSVGVWIIMAVWVWEVKRTRVREKKEGKELLL